MPQTIKQRKAIERVQSVRYADAARRELRTNVIVWHEESAARRALRVVHGTTTNNGVRVQPRRRPWWQVPAAHEGRWIAVMVLIAGVVYLAANAGLLP